MARWTTPRAVAEHLGWNYSDVTDCRYQETRNTQAIYTICDSYMTACPLGKNPKKFEGYEWKPFDSWITVPYGWVVYEAAPNE